MSCSVTDGGRQTPTELLDYAYLMRGDRRHSLPPTYLSANIQTYALFQIAHLAPTFTCFFFYYKYTSKQKSATFKSLQNKLKVFLWILYYPTKTLDTKTNVLFKWRTGHYQSFMQTSSSWQEKMEDAGTQASFPVCSTISGSSNPFTLMNITHLLKLTKSNTVS